MSNLQSLFGANGFDSSSYDKTQTFEPMPAGYYVLHLVESELKPTKTGHMISAKFEVLEGANKGRKFFESFNIQNANKDTESWARRDFAILCDVVGVIAPRDTQELHYKPFVGKVKVIPAKDGYDAKNGMNGYLPATPENIAKTVVNASPAQTGQPSPFGGTPAAQQTGAPTGQAPWSK